VVIARLERDVGRRTACGFTTRVGVAQRLDFGMGRTRKPMPALTDRATVANEHGADRRVWRNIAARARRKFDGPPKIDSVGGVYET